MEKIISLLMSFILMILSLFGGTGGNTKGDDDESDSTTVPEYNYTIYDNYFEFSNLQYGEDDERNILDLYIPRTNTKCEMGLVLFIHGGGWLLGDKSTFSSKQNNYALNYALENGYACASINYSYLSPTVDMYDILDDITDSLTAIKYAGEQVAVTINKTVMIGHSAGAHLSLLYSYSMADVAPIEPVAAISYAGPTDLTSEEYWTTARDIHDNYYSEVPADGNGMSALEYILSRAIGETVTSYDDVETYKDKILDVSPVKYYETAVPTVLIHGKQDYTVPYSNSADLNALLDTTNVEHTLITYDNSGHGLDNEADAASIAAATAKFNSTISKYLTNVKDLMGDVTETEPFTFTYLEYPEEAVKSISSYENMTVGTLTARADKNDTDVYAACQGYDDVNGLVISPYYTAKIDDKSIPVYAATVYIGATGKGALHSFSEIYIEDGNPTQFTVQLNSTGVKLTSAVYMTNSEKITATTKNGVVTATLDGYGIYTFLFNNESQEYAYTLFVREQIDDDAEIAKLEAEGYTVEQYSGLVEFGYDDIYYYNIGGSNNRVIYLRQGTYVTAANKQDISDASSDATYTEGSDLAGIGGLSRYPFIGGSGCNHVKIMGHGAIDLTALDRTERKGFVFSWGSDIEISGIKIINSAEWAIQTYRINGLTIKDVDIFGYRLNSDAFDICNSQNVTVDNCFARSGDDLFAVKTLGGEDKAECYSTDITITNCVAWAGKARPFGISGEANLPISNVTFKDCAVICHDATWGHYEIAAIGIMVTENNNEKLDSVEISDITFENIKIYRNDAAAFSCYVLEDVAYPVIMKNITFKNITYPSNTVKSKVYTVNSGSSIDTVIFENVYCNGTKIGDNYPDYIETASFSNGIFR